MVLFKKNERRKFLFIISLVIITMMNGGISIISNAQTDGKTVPPCIERLRYWGDLLKQNIEKYAEIRKNENIPKKEVILLLDNILEILRIIKKIHEEEKLDTERIHKIERLIQIYEKARSYYLLK